MCCHMVFFVVICCHDIMRWLVNIQLFLTGNRLLLDAEIPINVRCFLSNASCQITYQVPDQCRWMRESHPQFPIRAWPRVVRCWGRRGPCTLPQGVSWYGRVPHLLVSPGQWGPDIRDATGNKWIGSFGIALGCWFDSQWHMAHMEEHLKNYETPRNMVFVCFCVQRVTRFAMAFLLVPGTCHRWWSKGCRLYF